MEEEILFYEIFKNARRKNIEKACEIIKKNNMNNEELKNYFNFMNSINNYYEIKLVLQKKGNYEK